MHIRWLREIPISAILLTGCSPYHPSKVFSVSPTESLYHKTLMKTEVVRFSNEENLTRLSIVATYLTENRQRSHNENERFVIGIYNDENETLHHVTFTLNRQSPLQITPLQPNDPELRRLSFVSPWYRYYLFRFPHQKEGMMQLHITYRGATETLRFSRHPKYIYTHRAFE